MDYRRRFRPGGTFFFTVVTYQRQRLLIDPVAFKLLQKVVDRVKVERPFRIQAWVVLPDHLHMIWTLPPGDGDYSGRWSKIKGQFTRQWLESGGCESSVTAGKHREQRRGIWQPKFIEHTIRDESDFIAHVEYIHFNPVNHGHSEYPKNWPYSSFPEFVRRGIYPIHWCCGNPHEAVQQPAFPQFYTGLE